MYFYLLLSIHEGREILRDSNYILGEPRIHKVTKERLLLLANSGANCSAVPSSVVQTGV